MKKIVFMGTPDFAAEVLRAILKGGYEVTGVVTQPDRPKGRKKTPVPCPVKEEAERNGLRIFQPGKLRNNAEALQVLRKMNPDVIVVAAFGQIIPKDILDLPEFGCLNVHASLLPSYRGAAPIQHAILDGCTKTGVTIMQMNEGLDTGDMIAKAETEIGAEETGGELFDRMADLGADLLIRTLPSVFDGAAVRTPQPEASPTAYASMISKADGKLDWTRDAAALHCQIRAMNPWPCSWTTLDGKTLRVWRAHESAAPSGKEAPGTVLTDGKAMAVAAGSGTLVLDEVQLEGKKRMRAADFLRGYHLSAGTVLR